MQSHDIRQASLEEIGRACQSLDGFSVCGHVNPDGDCLGSVLGMTHILRSMGKEVQPLIATSEPLGEPFTGMPGADGLIEASEAHPTPVFITVDAAADERLGEEAAELRAASDCQIVIDHHEVSDCMADMCHIDPQAPSATCLVWELACVSDVPLTCELASCCYTGLMTDTGRFQYQNTDARAFRLAAQMKECGVDVALISQQFFQNKPLAAVRMEALATERLELLANGDIALSWITQEDLARLDAKRDDCEGVINVLRSIRGVKIACVLKDYGECIRGSLRSKDGTDVSRIAARFGGGGHKAAAGFTLKFPLDEAMTVVQQALIESRVS